MTVTLPDVVDRGGSTDAHDADVRAPRPGDATPPDVTPPGGPRPVPASLQPWTPARGARGWVLLAVVTAVAAVTRLWALGFPSSKNFDEIYYATEAQELLRYGYEDNRGYMFIVHPPLGKWFIAATSALFGDDPWGWRLAPALAGIACVVIVTRLARRMTRSDVLGAVAGLLLALEGMSLVLARVALLDVFLELFVLAGFAALVVDRDALRGRLAALLLAGVDLGAGVPALGPRPWRLVAGVCFGAACAVKWSALSFWVGFALLSLWWDRGAFKAAGAPSPWATWLRRSALWAPGPLLVAPVATYLFAWTGWFAGENSWNRHWGDGHWYGALGALVQYHEKAYQFHESLDSFHPYRSNPWSWLVVGRPVTFYYEQAGVTGCGPAGTTCAREILLLSTPLLWWGFLPAVLWLAWVGVTRRDWRGGMLAMAFAAGWLVWFPDLRRTMFLFYMAPMVPFLVITLTMALGAVLGPATPDGPGAVRWPSRWAAGGARAEHVDAVDQVDGTGDVGPGGTGDVGDEVPPRLLRARRRRVLGTAAVAAYLGVVVTDFVWMWPLFTGGLLTYDQWHAHMWFPSWV